MTFNEIKKIPDLQIEVTPAVEDAFFFIHAAIKDATKLSDAQLRCRDRLMTDYTQEESQAAVDKALKMIDNLQKYGVACAEWT